MSTHNSDQLRLLMDAKQATQALPGGFDKAANDGARAGKEKGFIGAILLLFGLMGAALLVVNYLRASDTENQQQKIEARAGTNIGTKGKDLVFAQHEDRLLAINGGVSATKTNPISRALPGLRGIWSGIQSCGNWWSHERTGLRLLLRSNSAGHINGVLQFFPIPDETSQVPYGSYRVSGDVKGEDVLLRGGDWVLQPPGYAASDLQLKLHNAPIRSMTGTIQLKDACGEVRLEDNVASIDGPRAKAPAAVLTVEKRPAAPAATAPGVAVPSGTAITAGDVEAEKVVTGHPSMSQRLIAQATRVMRLAESGRKESSYPAVSSEFGPASGNGKYAFGWHLEQRDGKFVILADIHESIMLQFNFEVHDKVLPIRYNGTNALPGHLPYGGFTPDAKYWIIFPLEWLKSTRNEALATAK